MDINMFLFDTSLFCDSVLIEGVMHDLIAKIVQGSNGSSILHTSAILGHIEFAKEILHRKPELAGSFHSQGSSPLHLAASYGHLEIVKVLLKVDSGQGQGREDSSPCSCREWLNAGSERVGSSQTNSDSGETAFHLCVKHNHLEALKLLVDSVDDASVVNMKDFEDNTILHLATAQKHIQMVDYLVTNPNVEVNATNMKGSTTLDTFLESPHDKADRKLKMILIAAGAGSEKEADRKLKMILIAAGAGGEKEADRKLKMILIAARAGGEKELQLLHRVSSGIQMAFQRKRKRIKIRKKDHTRWLVETKSTLMVVAILIAIGTFEIPTISIGD
ncbi:hypothetical protein ACLOJK_019953 [Asimina triloba]